MARGFRLLKRRNDVEGCFRAAERKEWSVLRKETRFNGEPGGVRDLSKRI